MRETARRTQLALEWTEAMSWQDLSTAVRAELRVLLRDVLRHAAAGAEVEGAPDE